MSKAVWTIHASPEALPARESVRFAGPVHPRLRVATPVLAQIERLPGEVRVFSQALDLSGSGRSSGEALEALGRAIAVRYYEQADSVLREHIAEQEARPLSSNKSEPH